MLTVQYSLGNSCTLHSDLQHVITLGIRLRQNFYIFNQLLRLAWTILTIKTFYWENIIILSRGNIKLWFSSLGILTFLSMTSRLSRMTMFRNHARASACFLQKLRTVNFRNMRGEVSRTNESSYFWYYYRQHPQANYFKWRSINLSDDTCCVTKCYCLISTFPNENSNKLYIFNEKW